MILRSKDLEPGEAAYWLDAQKSYSDGQIEMAKGSPHLIWVIAGKRFLPQKLRNEIFERDGHTCVYCGETEGELQIDHIFPFSRGGSDDPENLCTACRRCNIAKSDKTPEEWLQ